MNPFQSLRWTNEGGGALILLDQRILPHQTTYLTLTDHREVADAIRTMLVRGAPAIGVAAAYGVCLPSFPWDSPTIRAALTDGIATLAASRPTAVNLFWALERMRGVIEKSSHADGQTLRAALLTEAHRMENEDQATNRALADFGADLLPDGANVLHHCNTGSLATVDYGTALGVIRRAFERGKNIHAYLSETRPRLQGASLSAYEMKAFGVPHTILVDGAAAYLMHRGNVDAVIVGCDRVAANGDTANKIGTYMHALCARAHNIPFYVAMPISTLDTHIASGAEIPVEERSADEVTLIQGVRIAPEGTAVWNPAFDVTPAALITAFVTETGVIYPPFPANLAALSE